MSRYSDYIGTNMENEIDDIRREERESEALRQQRQCTPEICYCEQEPEGNDTHECEEDAKQ
jgi:hypothetical protein